VVLDDLPRDLAVRPSTARHDFALSGDASAVLALDVLVHGRATGGLRLLPEVNRVDMAVLARLMSWKFALGAGRTGGAKAALMVPEGSPVEPALARLADLASPHVRTGRWVPGPDIGLSVDRTRAFVSRAGDSTVRARASWETSGRSTAVSCVAALRWAAGRRRARTRTAAVVGLGSVGSSVVDLLAADGTRVVAVATSRGAWRSGTGFRIDQLTANGPVGVRGGEIDLSELLAEPVDALVLAGPDLTLDAVPPRSVAARLVVSAANLPGSPSALDALHRHEVLVLPPTLCSWGGVLGGVAERLHLTPRARELAIAAATRHALDAVFRRYGLVDPPTWSVGRWAERRLARRPAP
jgi:glutamate dehydrogenase/leucine dehydrogenase